MSTSNTMLNHQGTAPTATVNFDIDTSGQTNAFWVPEIYSKNVLMTFRKSAVAEAICNTDYFGEIKGFGDTVNIIKEPEITVYPYRRGGELGGGATGDWARTQLTDEEMTLTIDQANVFEFFVEDLETRFTHINWNALAADRAAYQLRDAMDTDILSVIVSGVSTSSPDNVIGADASGTALVLPAYNTQLAVPVKLGHSSATDPLDLIARMARLLTEQNVPQENRWLVASPDFYESLAKTDSKLMSVDYNQGDGGLRNGLVQMGKIRGFSLYESLNLPATTYAHGVVVAGHMSAVACASDMNKVESYRSQTQWGDAVRGLFMWGRKVLRDEALVAAYYAHG